MQDPIRLTFEARDGRVGVALCYLADLNTSYHHFLEPAAAEFSAERLRRAADAQPQAGGDREWDVHLLARVKPEEDGPDWVQVDLIDRNIEAHGPAQRGGMEPDAARAAAAALEAAVAGEVAP